MDNKFCVGTKIVFKDEIGGGKITSVINHSKVLILRDDGFEDVYSIDSILVLSDETYSRRATYQRCNLVPCIKYFLNANSSTCPKWCLSTNIINCSTLQ